ncbi:MAG TPA: PAS domain-containing sensor histidine kinase [Burkholderiales bacterium]|nr:PAS domain-containing sensor histidine kinase [Burkholderiales bacterium]
MLAQSEDYALFLMDAEGTITDWYHGAEHIFGFTAEEIVGQSARRLFNKEDLDRGAADHEMEVARTTRRAEDDRWHVRKDGTLFWGSGVLIALYDAAGRMAGYAKVVRNRTDVKAQTEALENQVRALEASAERTRVFLGTLAHELRNPLAPLANATQMLRSQPSPAPDEEILRIIDRQLALLTRLVEDLMDTARIEAGKVRLDRQVLDLTEVFNAAAQAVRPMAQARGVELQVVPIAGTVPVYVDAQRMQQVFVNLLDNGLKYTRRGGKVLFNLTTEGGDAIVRVEDTGIGMSAEILPRIFELFTQEESARKHAGGGVGLGLPLVHQLVQLHGGTVQARSDGRDKGSVFTVRLPMHNATQA